MGPSSKELVPLENTTRCQRVISQENTQPKTQIVGSNVESNYVKLPEHQCEHLR